MIEEYECLKYRSRKIIYIYIFSDFFSLEIIWRVNNLNDNFALYC